MAGMRTTIALLLLATCCHAETVTFGEGESAFEIEFVPIGNPGNAPDTRPQWSMGSVDYVYQIAKYELSCDQANNAEVATGIDNFAVCMGEGKVPSLADWPDAAIFVNWLNTSSGFHPAYKINDGEASGATFRLELWQPGEPGYDADNPTRNALAKFVLPSADEWHKAAYYDPSEGTYRLYATGDVTPTNLGPEGGTAPNTALYDSQFNVSVMAAGGLSAYGTMGQTGNVSEWEESRLNLQSDDLFGVRGDRRGKDGPLHEQTALAARQISKRSTSGIRVVAVIPVPEPSTLSLLAFALCSLGTFRFRR